MLWFKRATVPPPSPVTARDLDAVQAQVHALRGLVEDVQRREAARSAEHAAMVDQLDRLYKRISARITRADRATPEPAAPDDESPLAMRTRLGR